MNTKKLIIAMLTGVLLIAGCTAQAAPPVAKPDPEPNTEPIITDVVEVEAMGQIIQFDGQKVHVLSGDIAEIFEVPNEDLSEYYLGQTVSVIASETGGYELKAVELGNYEPTHTNMGDPIRRLSGTTSEVKADSFSLATDSEVLSISKPEEITVLEDASYEMDIIFFNGGGNYMIGAYQTGSQLKLTVEDLVRIESGELMIHADDDKSGKFIIGTYYPVRNFALQDLKIGDSIQVYADNIMESHPAQVIANRIDRVTE